MQRGSYEVNVLGVDKGTPNESASGYVYMKHDQKYAIEMANRELSRCDAEVKIDGKVVGVWRLDPYEELTIERPADDDGIFTFYRKGSNEEKKVNAGIKKDERGLIQVRFIPEKQCHVPVYPWWWQRTYPWNTPTYGATSGILRGGNIGTNQVNLCSHSSSSKPREEKTSGLESGVTGLSGQSDQRFNTVAAISRDYSKAVTISLRLVAKRKRGRKRKKKQGARPLLAAKANPVPKPVD